MKEKEKIYIVTGATSGIGKETATGLLKLGGKVGIVARSAEKAKQTANDLIKETGNDKLNIFIADLSLISQVRKLADDIKSKYSHIDVLINNAGVSIFKRTITKECIEQTFATNHLAPFLLTNLLLDLLKKSAPSRIVNVSSEMYKNGKFDINNLQWEKNYNWSNSYCSSKLYNILFTMSLVQRLQNTRVTANSLHPGLVKSNIGAGQGFMSFMKRMIDIFAISSFEGAKTSIYLASSDQIKGVSGCYFVKCKEEKPKSKYLTTENAEKLWGYSANIVG